MFRKIKDWFKNVVWTDKFFHYLAGFILAVIFHRYIQYGFDYFGIMMNAWIITHIIILAFNCWWEYKFMKEEYWCWIDWTSVELGAISLNLIYLVSWKWSPIGFVILIGYSLIQAWYWKIWPFSKRG